MSTALTEVYKNRRIDIYKVKRATGAVYHAGIHGRITRNISPVMDEHGAVLETKYQAEALQAAKDKIDKEEG